MEELLIEHGYYRARIQLYDEPKDDMVGMMSVGVGGQEHCIKLTNEDLHNLIVTINKHLLKEETPH